MERKAAQPAKTYERNKNKAYLIIESSNILLIFLRMIEIMLENTLLYNG